MNPILIFILVFLALFISYGLGVLTSAYFVIKQFADDDEDDEDDEEEFPDLYCFQCEKEMSTRVKNGNLYCGNCGLRH